jgi:hypothetical protein
MGSAASTTARPRRHAVVAPTSRHREVRVHGLFHQYAVAIDCVVVLWLEVDWTANETGVLWALLPPATRPNPRGVQANLLINLETTGVTIRPPFTLKPQARRDMVATLAGWKQLAHVGDCLA